MLWLVAVVALVAAGAEPQLVIIDDLTALDRATGELVPLSPSTKTAQTPSGPIPRRAHLAATDAWVGCSGSDDAHPFDPPTQLPGSRVDLLPGDEVWIPGASGDGVVVLDRATGAVLARIPTGEYAIGVAFTADASTALVSARDGRNITRIDAATHIVLGALAMPAQPGNMALDPVSQKIYAVEWYGPDLYEISADGMTLLRTATIGDSLWQLVVAPDGNRVYVTERDPALNLVRIVDPVTMTELSTVAVGDDPWGIDITSDGGKLLVACEDDSLAQVIDTATFAVTDVPLDATADPRDVDILDETSTGYVVGGDTTPGEPVYVVDLVSDTLLGSFLMPCSNTNVIAVQGRPAVSNAGACCDGVGGCTVVDPASCAGRYQGDGTDCTSGCGACCDGAGGCTDTIDSVCTDTFVFATFCNASPDPCAADCLVGLLSTLGNTLQLMKGGVGRRDLVYAWIEPLDGAAEYHVNYVALKAETRTANRSPGPALDACTIVAPASSCTETLGLDRPDPDAFYQAVSACGAAGSDEGPL